MTDTRTRILETAEKLTKEKGFNGFSYIDLSKEIGIKTSSIHYYYKSKDDLAIALIERMEEQLEAGMQAIENGESDHRKRLEAFASIFKGLAENNHQFCLCGMMSAELASLPEGARRHLSRAFQKVRSWAAKQFAHIAPDQAFELSVAFISALEGALLIARVDGNPEVIDQTLKIFIKKD